VLTLIDSGIKLTITDCLAGCRRHPIVCPVSRSLMMTSQLSLINSSTLSPTTVC